MCTQNQEELESGTGSSEQIIYCASPIPGEVRQSHDDDSSIRDMRWEMAYLLTVFTEPEPFMWNATNCWRLRPFIEISANESMPSDAYGEERTYCTDLNMVAFMDFDTFIGFVPDAGQRTSVVWVDPANYWMKCVRENLHYKLKGVPRGGWKSHFLKTRYNALLSVATTNL